MTATAIAKLALKFKCDLIPAYCIRKKGVSFKIKYLEPITYKKIKIKFRKRNPSFFKYLYRKLDS